MNDSLVHRAISVLSGWIYSFHMPLFIALSGTIYGIQKDKGMYQEFKPFVANKAKRLLIPLVIVWWVYRFPIMHYTGFYSGVSGGRLMFQMLAPNCVYLWYLEALFLIFIIIYFLDKVKNKMVETVIVAVFYLIGLVVYRKFSAYHFLGDPLYYLLWFYIGMHAEKHVAWLDEKRLLNKIDVWIILLVQIGLFLLTRKVEISKIISIGLQNVVLPLLMLIIVYYWVNHYTIRNTGRVHKMSSYCMGIYLYAEPLNYLLLYQFYTWCGIGVFASEMGSLILCLLRVLLTPVVAIGITWVLKKTKLRYLC